MPRERLPRGWIPIGRARGGLVRPLRVIPGTEAPWVRMGAAAPAGALDRAEAELGRRATQLGTLAQEEIERGQVYTDTATGRTCVLPDTEAFTRLPYLVDLVGSGSRGVPLTSERPLVVIPGGLGGGGAGFVDPALAQGRRPPATDLTGLWPFLFPPGIARGERPVTTASLVTTVLAGATVNLLTLPELARGLEGKVAAFGQTAADFSNLTWTILIKGRPADPIVGITFQFGELFRPTPLPGSGIPLGPGDDLIVQVTNSGAGAVAGVRARLDLYTWMI